MQVGSNVEVQIKGDILTITVNLKERLGKSASGKTTKIASTNGNIPLNHESGAIMGLNIYHK